MARVDPEEDRCGPRGTPLARDVGVHREGESFYTLRHVFCTWAQERGDGEAVDRIMGTQPTRCELTTEVSFRKPDDYVSRTTFAESPTGRW